MPRGRTRISITLAATAFALTLGACSFHASIGGTSAVSRSKVETVTATQLAAEVHQPVPKITCPSDLKAKVGATLDCVLVAQGATTRYAVHLEVDRVKGSDVHWNAQVADTPISGD